MPQTLRSVRRLALSLALVPAALLAATVPAGPDIAVRVATTGGAEIPLVGVFPDGGFVVAWTTGSPTTVIHARLFKASGAPASGEVQLVQPYNQFLDGLAVLADGGFVIVWEQARPKNRQLTSVLARRFDRAGHPVTPAFVAHEPSPLSVFAATVAATPDGGFAIAWTADIHVDTSPILLVRRDTFVRRFSSRNAATGPAQLIALGDTADDSFLVPTAMAAGPDGTLILTSECYCDGPGMTLHRIPPGGDAENLEAPPFNFDELAVFPSLAMARDGSFVVAWATAPIFLSPPFQTPSAIKARRFAADGTPLGETFQVNRRGGFEVLPHVASLEGGGFVVVWTDIAGRDGSGLGIFARSYAADGSTAGPDVRVNLTTAGDQFVSSLAADGQAVAVWTAPNQGVKARRLTSD